MSDAEFDNEVGKGRKPKGLDSDTSSREGSPARGPLSPRSDDDHAQANSDDTPPPPPSAPLFRKPVAFGGDSSTAFGSLRTYPALIPNPKKITDFLPGQEVGPMKMVPYEVPQAKAKRRKKDNPPPARTSTAACHYSDNLQSNTAVFKLTEFNPDANSSNSSQEASETPQASGPYGSNFRAKRPPAPSFPQPPAPSLPPDAPSFGYLPNSRPSSTQPISQQAPESFSSVSPPSHAGPYTYAPSGSDSPSTSRAASSQPPVGQTGHYPPAPFQTSGRLTTAAKFGPNLANLAAAVPLPSYYTSAPSPAPPAPTTYRTTPSASSPSTSAVSVYQGQYKAALAAHPTHSPTVPTPAPPTAGFAVATAPSAHSASPAPYSPAPYSSLPLHQPAPASPSRAHRKHRDRPHRSHRKHKDREQKAHEVDSNWQYEERAPSPPPPLQEYDGSMTPPPALRSPSPAPLPQPRKRSKPSTYAEYAPSPPPPSTYTSSLRAGQGSGTSMVDVYIDDLRGSVEDPQFTQVHVKVRESGTGVGWTISAKELCDALQNSPSRIDGPAKVYTLRNQKYRQFFLRVSAENVDQASETNLEVKPDKSLQIFIENVTRPVPQGMTAVRPPVPTPAPASPAYQDWGRAALATPQSSVRGSTRAWDSPAASTSTLSQKRRRSRSPAPTYRAHSPTVYEISDSSRAPSPAAYRPSTGPAKRANHGYTPASAATSAHAYSPPRDAATPAPARAYSPAPSPAPSTAASTVDSRYYRDHTVYKPLHFDISTPGAPPAPAPSYTVRPRAQHPAQPPVPPPRTIPGQVTRANTQQEVDRIVANHIRLAIEADADWTEWFPSRAVQQTVPEVLRQYRFAKRKIDYHVNMCTPADLEGAPKQRVRPEHVMRALKIQEEEASSWTRNCLETLRLVELYGKGGTRFEDAEAARVQMEEFHEGMPPVTPGKPMKKFLKYLKDLDARWLADHPGDAPSNNGKRKEKRSEDYTTNTFRVS